MPDHRTHRFIDRIFLGREREDVHSWMDAPYKQLGAKHRVLRHDPISLFAKYHDDPEGFFAGMLHILTDFGVSEAKRNRRVRKNVKSRPKRRNNRSVKTRRETSPSVRSDRRSKK